MSERIDYKLLSLTYKVLTTTQPSCLHNLITVHTRSSSLITLARPSTSSSLRITDRSFQYTSPRLWNQLPASVRQPRTNLSNSDSLSSSSIGSIDSPLSSSVTPSLFHSTLKLKTFLLCKCFTSAFLFFFRTDSADSPDCSQIPLSISGFLLFSFLFFHFLIVGSLR